MKNFVVVLFTVILAGCASPYATNPETKAAYEAGKEQGELAGKLINNELAREEGFRDGLGEKLPANISISGSFRGSSVRGGFGYQSRPYGYGWGPGYYPLDWRSQLRPPCRRW